MIVKNIDKILAVVKTVVDKLKEAFTKIKEFYIETLEPALTSIFEGVGNIMETFEDVFDFVIDVNPLKDFGGLLNTVMMGILSIGYRLGNQYNPVKPRSLPPGVWRGSNRNFIKSKTSSSKRGSESSRYEEAKRTKAIRDAANLRKQADIATGSTRRRLLRQAKRLEKTVGGADTSSVATATADKPGQPGQRTPRLITKTFNVTKEFSDDLQASKQLMQRNQDQHLVLELS